MYDIVNWLLTRKCNLKCEYCGLVDNVNNLYPQRYQFYQSEKDFEYYISCLKMIQKTNPNSFNIFYGGEPLLYKNLYKIINFCNESNINYTIITNSTLQKELDDLIAKVETLQGLTFSCDPMVVKNNNSDRDRKSKDALMLFEKYSNNKKVKDLVAEITLDDKNYKYAYDLCKELEKYNVMCSITVIDDPKTIFYDFAKKIEDINIYNVVDDIVLYIKKCMTLTNIHMPEMLNILIKSLNNKSYYCNNNIKNLNNITIDSDGMLRLCLRIRGFISIDIKTIIENINDSRYCDMINKLINLNYDYLCNGCLWTCPMMTDSLKENNNLNKLLHKEDL